MPQIVLIIAACINLLFFILYQRNKWIVGYPHISAVILKIVPTLCSVCLAVYGAVVHGSTGSWLLCAGLAACLSADWAIDYSLIYGMGVFAIGHIAFCVGYVLLSPPNVYSILVMAAMIIPFLWLYFHFFKKQGTQSKPELFLCYATLLSIMVGLASAEKPILFCGALFFAISDGMIGWRLVRTVHSKLYDDVCMGLYYLALYLIATSIVV